MKSACPIQCNETQPDNTMPTLLSEASLPSLHREDVLNNEFHWFRRASVVTSRNTIERLAKILSSASDKARQTKLYAALHGQLQQKFRMRKPRVSITIPQTVLSEVERERLKILSWTLFQQDLGAKITPDKQAWFRAARQTTSDDSLAEVPDILSCASPDLRATRIFAYLIGAIEEWRETLCRNNIHRHDMPDMPAMPSYDLSATFLKYARTFRDDHLFLREVEAYGILGRHKATTTFPKRHHSVQAHDLRSL